MLLARQTNAVRRKPPIPSTHPGLRATRLPSRRLLGSVHPHFLLQVILSIIAEQEDELLAVEWVAQALEVFDAPMKPPHEEQADRQGVTFAQSKMTE